MVIPFNLFAYVSVAHSLRMNDRSYAKYGKKCGYHGNGLNAEEMSLISDDDHEGSELGIYDWRQIFSLVAMVTPSRINVQVIVLEMARNENLRFLPFI